MRPFRSLLALTLTAVAATLGLLVQTTGPAAACSCAGGDIAQHARWADAVFTGTLADGPQRGGQQVTYTFDVDRVYAGDVASTAEVRTGGQQSACGMQDLEPGRTYVVYASGSHDVFTTNLCSGTRATGAGYVDRLQRHLGAGAAPADARRPPGRPDARDDDGPGDLALVGGLAGAVIVAAIAAGALRARRRA